MSPSPAARAISTVKSNCFTPIGWVIAWAILCDSLGFNPLALILKIIVKKNDFTYEKCFFTV